MNPLFNKDAYKIGHKFQYPKNTEYVYSNLTPRGDRLAPFDTSSRYYNNEIIFVGLQRFIKQELIENWNNNFFNKPKNEVVEEYDLLTISMGLKINISHIENLYDLGYLPIKIKALPEGSRVPMKVPVLTIVNTLPEFDWIVNFLETSISNETWKTITTATIADQYKQLMLDYARRTGTPKDFVAIQGHDFSARGMSGNTDSANSGIGHLTSFIGTDTLSAISSVSKYYNMNLKTDLIGVSVPATEHAVMMLGQKNNELDTYRRLINEVYPTGIVSIVSDTWDFWSMITNGAKELKNDIMARQPDALGFNKVVFRPDSGDPVKIICGDPDFINKEGYNGEDSEPQYKGAVECLWDIFGGTITKEGYKLLDEHVGLIYGDSITIERATQILEGLERKGFASGNIVFGIGSYTYQYLTRDSFGMAIKATWGQVNGEAIEIFKDPKTDTGDKKSAKGLMRVEFEDGKYIMYDQQTSKQESQGEFKTIFENGKLIIDESFTTIRNRIQETL